MVGKGMRQEPTLTKNSAGVRGMIDRGIFAEMVPGLYSPALSRLPRLNRMEETQRRGGRGEASPTCDIRS